MDKKIIDGKMYNRETAKLVGEWDNGVYGNDFRYCYEELYFKKTGEFFMYGKGGAMSKYSERRGSTTYGGEAIIPLSFNEAKQWAETHLDADTYQEIFGKVEEDGSTASILVRTTSSLQGKLNKLKIKSPGKSLSDIVVDILDEYIETNEFIKTETKGDVTFYTNLEKNKDYQSFGDKEIFEIKNGEKEELHVDTINDCEIVYDENGVTGFGVKKDGILIEDRFWKLQEAIDCAKNI